MNKLLKRILTGFGIILGLLIILSLAYMFKAKSEIKKFTVLETQQITEDLFSIKDGYVNVYLVKSNSGFILFDAGNNVDNIKSEINKLNISPYDVEAVFLTHTDKDHSTSVPLFEKANIYLSKEEQRLINGEASRFLMFGNKIDCEEYNLVSDNQILNIGGVSIKCIVTPGHTPGATCFLVNNQYLFTGDALSLVNGKVEPFNDFFNMDTETQIKSMEKLSKLDSVQYILSAHYGMADNYEKAFNLQE